MVDWGQALQIAGIGFLAVFVVLVIVAIVIRIIGLLLAKTGVGGGSSRFPQEGE